MITINDQEQIASLVERSGLKGKLSELEAKLNHFSRAPSPSSQVVGMNSLVTIRDLHKNEVYDVRLVYQMKPLQGTQVSVLAPLGTALLGAEVNETITFQGRDLEDHTIFILAVSPES